MDGTRGTAACLSQRNGAERGQQLPKSWSSPGAPCTVTNGDQVWLEELVGFSSYQSSTSQPSSSPGGSRSSSSAGSLYSRSSGATCILHSSIKKQSQEAFQTRLQEERTWRKCPSSGPPGGNIDNTLHAWPESGGLARGWGSAQTLTSTHSVQLQWLLEEKAKAKLKFSRFLDEVTFNVLDPKSLKAFGKPASGIFSLVATSQAEFEGRVQEVAQLSPGLPCTMALQQDSSPEQKTQDEQTPADPVQKPYLETDLDSVRRDNEPEDLEMRAETPPQLQLDEKNVIPPPPQFCQGFEMKVPFPESSCHFPKYPHRSASLPRGINMVPDEEMNDIDTISQSANSIKMRKMSPFLLDDMAALKVNRYLCERAVVELLVSELASEFDSTRQYLETELRRAQEELDKFTDKLRR
ncbi:uncharacterized protein V6R79_010029 [Siganus canaliculatus]